MNADSSIFVVLLGLTTTFIGLICIILLAKIMSFCCSIVNNNQKEEKLSNISSDHVCANSDMQIPNRGEFVAAISAAIAEEIGTDISSIKILSIKQV